MPKPNQHRPELDISCGTAALEAVAHKLEYRLNQKGRGSFASSHEILGILIEEMTEFTEEVHKNSSSDELVKELLDIAVAAVWGIASIESGGTDW